MRCESKRLKSLYGGPEFSLEERRSNILKGRAERAKVIDSLSNKDLKKIALCHKGLMEFIGRDNSQPIVKRYLTLLGHGEESGKGKKLYLTKKQTLDMSKRPASYFTSKEALIIGVNICFHGRESRILNRDLAKPFFERAFSDEESSMDNRAMSQMILGLQHFGKGVEEEKFRRPENKRNLKMARTYFIRAMKYGMGSDVVTITLGIIEGLMGEFEKALKYLYSSLKITEQKIFVLLLITKIYTIMELHKVALFYQKKVNRLEGKEEGAKIFKFKPKIKEEANDLFTFHAA